MRFQTDTFSSTCTPTFSDTGVHRTEEELELHRLAWPCPRHLASGAQGPGSSFPGLPPPTPSPALAGLLPHRTPHASLAFQWTVHFSKKPQSSFFHLKHARIWPTNHMHAPKMYIYYLSIKLYKFKKQNLTCHLHSPSVLNNKVQKTPLCFYITDSF